MTIICSVLRGLKISNRALVIGIHVETEATDFIVPWMVPGKSLADYTCEDMRALEFESLQQAEHFYSLYSKAKGFGYRNSTVLGDKVTGAIISTYFVCFKEGKHRKIWDELKDRKRKPSPYTRCHCEAMIHFRCVGGMNVEGEWRWNSIETATIDDTAATTEGDRTRSSKREWSAGVECERGGDGSVNASVERNAVAWETRGQLKVH
ncbi:hypothetical protein CRG98_001320 [Punica granatum]|uniref:FAR1 domain-containing protein n=1 Tax=Punica granatum TaxID=22663 RepID=A0A2I0LC59_PUNGR|nr:hypothetical protein CRG98_001320 [Punica granatum]